MAKLKLFNDPVYGFVTVPDNLLMRVIDHPYFQRLRRIKQLGMTHLVYPGALHTRFHHALGAFHLMQQTLLLLKMKGVEITKEENQAAQLAILLHDIGHGPFSHALEFELINLHHETISGLFLEQLNQEFNGELDLALQIFYDKYPKRFLHQLVSGQLDVDRMDYLNRDSFYTGVSEGVIGYDRLIKMMNVADGNLVIEEKGIHSIEKFLMARRIMYLQVYLHKTVLSAETMLIQAIKRAKYLLETGSGDLIPSQAYVIFETMRQASNLLPDHPDAFLAKFATWDDHDVTYAIKKCVTSEDRVLKILSSRIIDRRLFKLEWSNEPFEEAYISKIQSKIQAKFEVNNEELKYLVVNGLERVNLYDSEKEEIYLMRKDGSTVSINSHIESIFNIKSLTKYYLTYSK